MSKVVMSELKPKLSNEQWEVGYYLLRQSETL